MAGLSGPEKASSSTARTAPTTTARLTINSDTTDPIVSAGPLGWEPPVPSPRRHLRWWLVPLVLVLVAAIVAMFVPLPYDTISPGSSRQVNDLVLVRGTATYPPRGRVLYTTVSVRERVNAYALLWGWLNSDVAVVSDRSVRGSVSPKQFQQLNVQAMTDSKKTAEAVALEHLGYHVLQGRGALVRAVVAGSPAAAILQPNDVIVAVDGKPVAVRDEAVDDIKARKPGDHVRLSVVRGQGSPRALEAVLRPGPDGGPQLGVTLDTEGLDVKLPFEINIDSGSVVGPSAGVAYALELIDVLTPGELTGGTTVAATGELGLDGSITAIGGVAQKTVTVERAGARVFLVPRANLAEARAKAGKQLKVYAVGTIDDALKVLGSLKGSNALALPKPAGGT